MIAQRMNLIDSSGIRKVFDLAAKLENPINLSIGQPDFDVPEAIKDAAIQAIRDGNNRYTQTQGVAALRGRLAEMLSRQYGVENPPLLVTSGVSGGLLLALMATVDPGDEVLIGDPYFVMYKHLVNLLGGRPVFVDTYPDFRLTAERIRPHITGMTREEIDAVLGLAAEHKLLVLTDEIYELFCYDEPHASAYGGYENTILLKGFSKTYGMTGWRLGYATGPSEIIQAMAVLQQYTFVCAPSMAQSAGLVALGTDMGEAVEDFRGRRDLIYDALKDDFEVARPSGAFYIFPKAPSGRAQEFVAKAIKRNVLIIPGDVFSEKGTHFRVSYAASREVIAQGAEVLCKLAREMG
jgi:aspartate/methionine/tyrosine aminotransferase